MTELIIKAWNWGEIASNFFVYKCFDQMTPTRYEYTMRRGDIKKEILFGL